MEDPTRETIATFMIQLKQSVAPVSRIGNDVEDVKGFEDASQFSDGPAHGGNTSSHLSKLLILIHLFLSGTFRSNHTKTPASRRRPSCLLH